MQMQTQEEKYNGWTNYETWAVKLHWDNNHGDYTYLTQIAREFKARKDAAYLFGDALKEYAEAIYFAVFDENTGVNNAILFVKDVGSLWRVNWREIAKAYYEEVDE